MLQKHQLMMVIICVKFDYERPTRFRENWNEKILYIFVVTMATAAILEHVNIACTTSRYPHHSCEVSSWSVQPFVRNCADKIIGRIIIITKKQTKSNMSFLDLQSGRHNKKKKTDKNNMSPLWRGDIINYLVLRPAHMYSNGAAWSILLPFL
jgi:hypothetical protein